MDSKNARFTASSFDSQSEIRGIDTYDHIRRGGKEIVQQSRPDTEQLTDSPQDFHQAHYRQALHRHQGMKAFGHHLLTANSHEAGLGIALAQRPDQAGTEDIPRCLAGNDSECDFTFTDGGVRKICHRQAPAGLADDAAVCSAKGVNEGPNFRNIGIGFLELFDSLLGGQALTVNDLVGPAKSQQYVLSETATFEAFHVHTVWLR